MSRADAPDTQPTDEMQHLSATVAKFMEFHETGGVCTHRGCKADAPYAVLDGRRVALPCPSHGEEERRQRAAEEVARRASVYMDRSGVTERLRPWSFDTYRESCADEHGLAALAVAERWLADFYASGYVTDGEELSYGYSRNLLFYGAVGSGKTGLAWAMTRDLIEHGVEARIVTFRKLLEEMRNAYSERVSVHKYLGALIRSPVLCLDDLGSEVPTKWAREQLLGIVDYRYEERMPTIYVSNYDPDSLAERLSHDDPIIGDRIVSRMTDQAIQHRFLSDDRREVAA